MTATELRKALAAACVVAALGATACGSGPEGYTCSDIEGDRTMTREVAEKVRDDFGTSKTGSIVLVLSVCNGEQSAKPYDLLKDKKGT